MIKHIINYIVSKISKYDYVFYVLFLDSDLHLLRLKFNLNAVFQYSVTFTSLSRNNEILLVVKTQLMFSFICPYGPDFSISKSEKCDSGD